MHVQLSFVLSAVAQIHQCLILQSGQLESRIVVFGIQMCGGAWEGRFELAEQAEEIVNFSSTRQLWQETQRFPFFSFVLVFIMENKLCRRTFHVSRRWCVCS